jgi:hypothetical protein
MAKVDIYKLNNDGSQKVVATCRLIANNTVICEGDKIFVGNLSKRGINDYTVNPPVKLYLSNGRKFLEQLKYNFTSGYLNASDIKE